MTPFILHIEFTYTINDSFDGVLTGGVAWALRRWGGPKGRCLADLIDWYEKHFGELDFPFSQPYDMTATWGTELNGRFQ